MCSSNTSPEPPPRPAQPGPKMSRTPHTRWGDTTSSKALPQRGVRTPEAFPSEENNGRWRQRQILPSCLSLLVASLLVVAIFVGFGIGLAAFTATSVQAPTRTSSVGTLPPAVADLQQQVIAVIHRVQPAVVKVQVQGAQGGAIGSGVILTEEGYIVTNAHVVRGFERLAVTLSDGQTTPAHLVGAAPQDDLAVLKIEATQLEPIVFGESSQAQVGQFVIALGSPFGLEQSATFGMLSGLHRTASGPSHGSATQLSNLIQVSAPINPGNSGGALVDLQGRLIGVPTLAATSAETSAANGIGFAIPSDRVNFVTQHLIQDGKAP